MSQRRVEEERTVSRRAHGIGRPGAAIGLLVAALLTTSACGTVETAQGMPRPNLQAAPVIQRETRLYREWAATLDGYFTVEIRPQVEGQLVRRLYRGGSLVEAGEVLFEIGPGEAPAALDRAVAAGWTKVVSPIAGIAGSARARAGDLVDARTILTTVSTVDWIKVFFYASRQEYLGWTKRRDPSDRRPSTHPGDKALFELILADGTPYTYRGHLLPAGRDAATTGTIALTAVFPNPDHQLRPGQRGSLRAAVDVSDRRLLVPEGAVFEQDGLPRVAVIRPDSTVEVRAVQAGERVGALRVIEEGLIPGDRVVVGGE
jgi:membrane fusion protein (multidrug efflux system)